MGFHFGGLFVRGVCRALMWADVMESPLVQPFVRQAGLRNPSLVIKGWLRITIFSEFILQSGAMRKDRRG